MRSGPASPSARIAREIPEPRPKYEVAIRSAARAQQLRAVIDGAVDQHALRRASLAPSASSRTRSTP